MTEVQMNEKDSSVDEVIQNGVVDDSDGVEVPEESENFIPGSKTWSRKIRRQAKSLASNLETGYMELARILYTVYDTPQDGDVTKPPLFQAWGYNSFADYAEEELGLHRRKAERLRRIWYKLEVELEGLDSKIKERIVKLGWSKTRELVRVLTVRNAKDWVDKAEKLNYPELLEALSKYTTEREARIREAESSDEEPNPDDLDPAVPDADKFKVETFSLAEPQLESVKTALERASELSTSKKKGHNLDLICTDFLATNGFLKGDDIDKKNYLAKVEKQLGVSIVAIDPLSDEIIFGLATLERLARAGAADSEEGSDEEISEEGDEVSF